MRRDVVDQAAPAGTRPQAARNHNLALLARMVVTGGHPSSRSQLAAAAGLNRSTVTRLVDHLLRMGIVIEAGARADGAGRPSVPLSPAPHTHVAIGAEIAADAVSACVVDLTGDVLAEHYVEVPGEQTPAKTMALLSEAIATLTAQSRSAGLEPVGVACGIPGVISADDGLLCTAPNLGWRNVDLPKLLASVSGRRESVPEPRSSGVAAPGGSGVRGVVFDNATSLATVAEQVVRMRRGEPMNDFIHVTGTTGVGGALVRGGELETGVHGWGGELGHVAVSDRMVPCSCGATGCLEAFAGRDGLMEAAGFARSDPLGNLFAALHRRDRTAMAAVAEAGHYLGRALAAYLNLVEVPVVVLGGHFVHLLEVMSEELRRELDRRVLFQQWSPVDVVPASSPERAVATGAAWRILLAFLDDPAGWSAPAEHLLNYYSVAQTPEATVE